jgi:regulation of enolase protein 1 (concanavalin A-like superfamily)
MSRGVISAVFVTLVLGLAVGQALGAGYDRAVYYDADYAAGWIGNPEEIRDGLAAAGYTVLDADALLTWMNGHIADGKLSVVVFAQDIVPDTVAESNTEDCTLRHYLNAGGKVVWSSDIPFYYVGDSSGGTTNWGGGGSTGILGFEASPSTGWDTGNTVTITDEGIAWGLTETWSSNRPAPVDSWDNFTALALDDAGNAAAWAAHYVAGDTFRGFVRTSDFGGNTASIANLMALAEYVLFFETATAPIPDDGTTDIVRNVILSWIPGEFAATHDVYFGTSFDDVSAADRANPLGVLVSQGQAAESYDPEGLLALGQTYYWRIDEVNAAPDNTVFKGDVWSFTAEPVAYPIESVIATTNAASDEGAGLENTVNGSGLNSDDQHSTASTDMWLGVSSNDDPIYIQYEFDKVYKLYEMMVWNYNVQFELILGFGLKDVTVEYSANGADWTALGDVELAKATAKATYMANTIIDLEGVAAKYVRLTVGSGWGMMGQYGLSEVRFLYVPAQAREPQPADGNTNIAVDTALAWRSGRDAVVHEVYFSADEAAVADGLALADAVSTTSYQPSNIEFGNVYYWKINEVNEADAASSWEGDLWSFSTQEFAVVEDFESYDDEDNRIYDGWVDGWVNETGSTVGYLEESFAERTIVNSGRQSMPLEYNNAAAPYYSEAEHDFGSGNWTTNGADTVAVSFQGRPVTFVERTDGSVLLGAGGADIWGGSDQFRFAYKELSGDGSIVARIDSLVNSNDWAKAGVMIRQNLNANAINAGIFVTPANGISFQYRTTAGADSANVAEAGLAAPYWVKLTRSGDIFTAQYSADGVTWIDLAAASDVEISMSGTVYIGLALTSHDAGIMTSAAFSNVTTAGSVGGTWQTEAIGVAQPGNDAESFYVVVEDTNGRSATVTHPDPEAALATTWRQWQIPLSAFAGVNMASVKTMAIGLGDRNNPTAGGTGLIYIDDIGFGTPLSHNVMVDITGSGDAVIGVPNDGDWPGGETPDLAIDNDTATKFLHFKGFSEPTGLQITPSVGATIVTEVTFTSANDAPERDPAAFELYGSNASIDGPYTLIASGDIADFVGATAWPRFTMNETSISFENEVAYGHYQILVTAVRDAASANSMQVAEIELIGVLAP